MAGRFDFQDALIDLFDAYKAYSTRNVDCLKGKQVVGSLSFFSRILFGSKTPHLILPQVNEFAKYFGKNGAKVILVDDGIGELSKEMQVDIFTRVHWIRNRFFYFKMIASIKNKISDEDREFFRQNELVRTLGSTDSVCTLCYKVIWRKDIESSIDNAGIKLIRAPEAVHNQILYFHSTDPTTELFCEPTVFLKSDLTRVIQKTDFEREELCDFDFSKLSESIKIAPNMLRKCLFGTMVFFHLSPKLRNNIKYFDSMVENISLFPSEYARIRRANLEILQKQVSYLSLEFKDDQIDGRIVPEIARIYNFDVESVFRFYCYFFKCYVLTNKSELVAFPIADDADEESLLLNEVDINLVRYFCNREINEDVFNLFAKCRDYTMTVFFPKLNVVEFEFANKIYYKEQMDWVISQYSRLFPMKKKVHMKFQYFFEKPERLNIRAEEEILAVPDTQIQVPVTLFNSLFHFWSAVQNGSPFKSIKSIENANKKDALEFINLVLLHRLKYINTEKRTLMIPAVAFIQANPSKFGEELILLFEIIRNNLLMLDLLVDEKSIFRSFEGFMQDNVLDEILYNDSVCSAFMKNIKKGGSSKSNQEFDPISEAFYHSFDIDSNVSNLLNMPPQSIRIGVKKSLSVFYLVIKEFQKEYKIFYNLGNSSVKAELILNSAFENYVMLDVQICSQIFCFVLDCFTVPDLFSINIYHFQHVVSVIQKSLQIVAEACKITYYHNTRSEIAPAFKSWLQNNLPFHKNYSVDGGKVVQIICLRFLILESLWAENETFAAEYAKQLEPSWLQSAYAINIDLKAFLNRGKTLVDKLLVFLNTIATMSHSSSYDYLLEHLPRISRLLARVIKFYKY